MKRIKIIFVLSYIVSLSLFLSGCQQDASIKVLQQFIIKQVQCETYKEAQGDEAILKKFTRNFLQKKVTRSIWMM